ncbi:MAG: hypothetical protein ACK5JT_03655 [Hyphomicrobiaceae bacterium]
MHDMIDELFEASKGAVLAAALLPGVEILLTGHFSSSAAMIALRCIWGAGAMVLWRQARRAQAQSR